MTAPSTALESLADCLRDLDPSTQITVGALLELVERAQRNVERLEYEDYAGEDL